jgi:hypothetical protein
MGITHLPLKLKGMGKAHSLGAAGLQGLVVGVDLMVVIHAAIPRKAVADQFWLVPQVPVTTVLDYVSAYVHALQEIAKVSNTLYS